MFRCSLTPKHPAAQCPSCHKLCRFQAQSTHSFSAWTFVELWGSSATATTVLAPDPSRSVRFLPFHVSPRIPNLELFRLPWRRIPLNPHASRPESSCGSFGFKWRNAIGTMPCNATIPPSRSGDACTPRCRASAWDHRQQEHQREEDHCPAPRPPHHHSPQPPPLLVAPAPRLREARVLRATPA